MALIKGMANSPMLTKPSGYKHGKLVFFDVLGWFMVHYPARIGHMIHLIIVSIVFISIMKKIVGYSSSKGRPVTIK